MTRQHTRDHLYTPMLTKADLITKTRMQIQDYLNKG